MLVDRSESEMKSKRLKQLSKYITKELSALGYKGSVCMFLQPGVLPIANVGSSHIEGRNSDKYLNRKRGLAITDKPSKKLKLARWDKNSEAYSDEDNNRETEDDDDIDIIHKKVNIVRRTTPAGHKLETKRLVPRATEDEKSNISAKKVSEEEKSQISAEQSSKPTTVENTNLEHFRIIAAFSKELRDSQENPALFSELKALRKRAKKIKRSATISRVELFLFLKDLCSALRKCKATGQWNKNLREGVNKFLGSLAVAEAIDLQELVCNWCNMDLSNNWLLNENSNSSSSPQKENLNILQQLPDNRNVNISEQSEIGIVSGIESQERDKPLLKKRKRKKKRVSKKRKLSRTSRQYVVEKIIQAYPQSEAFTSHDIEVGLKANKYEINMSTISKVLQQLVGKEVITKYGKRGRFILYTRCVKEKANAKIKNKRLLASKASQVQSSLKSNSELSETTSVISPAKAEDDETLDEKKVWRYRNARVYDVENIYTGSVKFFLGKLGYGFIIPDEEIEFMGKTVTPDADAEAKTGALYVGRNDIIFAEGSYRNLNRGTRMQFQVYKGEKGMGAYRVRNEDGTAYEHKWPSKVKRENINAGIKKKRKKKKEY